MAAEEPARELARKWMVQSEREFQSRIELAPKDDYGYSGLAGLYMDWAKRADASEETTEYLAKAESTISSGLGKVYQRESLLIASAEIEKILGNDPNRISKLRQAVNSSSQAVVSRYLLGRALRAEGKPQEAIQVLDPVVRTEFSEVRAYVEYVKALLDTGASYEKCWNVLGLAKLDGMSYPPFIGLYAGLLYMDGKYEEAKKVWQSAEDKGFTYEERYRAQFRPRNPDNRGKALRLEGVIAKVSPGYVVIGTSETPNFVSTRTMVGKTFLKRGTMVSFEPAFSARGSHADNLRLT